MTGGEVGNDGGEVRDGGVMWVMMGCGRGKSFWRRALYFPVATLLASLYFPVATLLASLYFPVATLLASC